MIKLKTSMACTTLTLLLGIERASKPDVAVSMIVYEHGN